VFCREDGRPFRPEVVNMQVRRHAQAASLPPIRVHDYADLRVMPTRMGSRWSERVEVVNLSA
jgi:hypothetical protein